jgi:hypothetical protein
MTATVTSVVASPATGEEVLGQIVTITLNMSEGVTVSGGTPKLVLNDNGVAIYDPAHSTTTSLVFDYTVPRGQTTENLAVTGVVLNGTSVKDSTGNNADLSGPTATFSGLQIDGEGFALAYITDASDTETQYVQTYDANLKPIALANVLTVKLPKGGQAGSSLNKASVIQR